MTFSLEEAFVFDIETFPNVFTLHAEALNTDLSGTWEISQFRDDRQLLMQWFQHLARTQTPTIGFNNLNFDYPVIHHLFRNPQASYQDLYQKAMSIIESQDRFGHMIWASDRFAPQIDLFKIFHMDNPAKSTSLKALQINMRSPSVVDMPIAVGTVLTEEQINNLLIPYNKHDLKQTKQFAHFAKEAINFRITQIEQFGIDVLNWPDTKIGAKLMESRLGDTLCYDRSSGRKVTRQTPRTRIALADIIFPYIQFKHPEFQRVHNYLCSQVLSQDEIKSFGEDRAPLSIKGVFTGLSATVGEMEFHFGTGGIHGSVKSQRIVATDEWLIRDIDVASLYPSIAIVNRLAPKHLGDAFCTVYANLPQERKKWQKEKGKKCVEANTLKLASNGVYGNSNNPYSVFYDPQFTLNITVNGQLLLCMLAEQLLSVPTLRIIQINTDGITYQVHRDHEPGAKMQCAEWEKFTCLVLEDADYTRMWIRDVNSYIAEKKDGSLKLKGAYWTPDPLNYHDSITGEQPPAWHKDLSNIISIRAAVAAMVHNVPVGQFLRMSSNPYDFMCRAKVKRSDTLLFGGREVKKTKGVDAYITGGKAVQKTSRYFVSNNGDMLYKEAPPAGEYGRYKRANGVTECEYLRVMKETNWEWDERVCTKNKSTYERRQTKFASGQRVTLCNDVADFDFADINYAWYIAEAEKLIIG